MSKKSYWHKQSVPECLQSSFQTVMSLMLITEPRQNTHKAQCVCDWIWSCISRFVIQIQNKWIQWWLNFVSAIAEIVSQLLVNRRYNTYKMSHHNCHPWSPQRKTSYSLEQEWRTKFSLALQVFPLWMTDSH